MTCERSDFLVRIFYYYLRCKLSVQAPPRSLKLKKGYRKKKTTQKTDEVVTVDGTPRKAITPTTPNEEKSDDGEFHI